MNRFREIIAHGTAEVRNLEQSISRLVVTGRDDGARLKLAVDSLDVGDVRAQGFGNGKEFVREAIRGDAESTHRTVKRLHCVGEIIAKV